MTAPECTCNQPGQCQACDWLTEADDVVICGSCGNEIPAEHGYCGLCEDATDHEEDDQ